jgi:2-methylaconitate cis-trans-isomerase PrpF
VQLKSRTGDGLPDISKVSVIRTARPLFEGVVYLRSSVSLGRGA